MNDNIRAAVLAFAQSVFPVLQLANVVNFTADEVAAIMLLIGNALTLIALIMKEGQQPDPKVAHAQEHQRELLEQENRILRESTKIALTLRESMDMATRRAAAIAAVDRALEARDYPA